MKNVNLSTQTLNVKNHYPFRWSDFVFQPTADAIPLFLSQIPVCEGSIELG